MHNRSQTRQSVLRGHGRTLIPRRWGHNPHDAFEAPFFV